MKTENQLRAWLKKKLLNYASSHITKGANFSTVTGAHKLETVSRDLYNIMAEFDRGIEEIKGTKHPGVGDVEDMIANIQRSSDLKARLSRALEGQVESPLSKLEDIEHGQM